MIDQEADATRSAVRSYRPQRDDELGETLTMSGTVKTPDGHPLAEAVIGFELYWWQAAL